MVSPQIRNLLKQGSFIKNSLYSLALAIVATELNYLYLIIDELSWNVAGALRGRVP